MSRLISELPYEIKLKAKQYQYNSKNDLSKAFIWGKTDEGFSIWEGIYNRDDYQSFYNFHDTKYPKQITPKQWCEEKGYNEYHVMIIEQYLKDIGKQYDYKNIRYETR